MMKSWADHCSSDEEDSTADDHHDHDDDYQVNDDGVAADRFPVDPDAVPVSPDEIVPTSGTMAGPAASEEERVYDFPTQAPFTAFVGNLSYQIKEPDMLVDAVSQLAKERLEEPVNVLGGRIAYHRTDPHGKHRGFGYVEVETLEQLKLLMTLNDGESMIAGRKVQMDTANHHNHSNSNNNYSNRRTSQGSRGSFQRHNRGSDDGNRSINKNTDASFSNVDGSKFRGGKYNNSNRDNNRRRSSNRSGFQSNDNDRNDSQDDAPAGPPAQRPSLKLAPRTKPVQGVEPLSSSSSNIFGGATARDEQAWQNRRASIQKDQETSKETQVKSQPDETVVSTPASSPEDIEPKNDNPSAHTDNHEKDRSRSTSGGFQEPRHSGKGRGGGRGRIGGRHDKGSDNAAPNRRGSRRNSTQQHQQPQDKKQPKQPSPEEKAAAAVAAATTTKVATAPPPQPTQKKTEVTNKFALLMDSDSE